MSTITASATNRDVGTLPDGRWSYVTAEAAAETYLIEARPAFDLELQYTGARWTVRDLETGIFGAGDTPSEALLDFQRAAREHLDVLQRQESLSDDLAAQLDYLRTRTE